MTFPPESGLLFEFSDAHWSQLLFFDKTKDFQNAQEALPGTKGVDFTGILTDSALVFMEVKNFRGYRIENKPRIENGEDPLWLEVAQKMRDAVAVTIGGARNSAHLKDTWSSYLEYLRNENKAVQFILWLEQDLPPVEYKAKRKWEKTEIDLRRDLKRSLRWLTTKVDVASIQNNPFPQALTVTFQ
ncbi:MAG: hypothetical protein K9J37_06260 [Saprospiraceae bacterium]|nr:hypothetical protein [Saprospiraceae bacterium]MCF8249495.1 hypothetical protein [Saprospiraceae bacterium]MCF8280120.1 hypothetical protein [Bacteroidales bacterium]MCF8310713.1 hypothetical protein [Saprospiraceae bacterium]MCF8439456.1 hypothetical protein [Saprospiraceae bacterium]